MRSTITAIVLCALTGCTLLSISEAVDGETGDSPGSPSDPGDEANHGETEQGWCCACGVNVGDALACTPASIEDCEGDDMTWCEPDAHGDPSECETACSECVCDCELGPSPGCISYEQATACASTCDLVWCCACEDFADGYIGAGVCDVVPPSECMDPGERSCTPEGIFAAENPVFDCWQQCQPAQFGWCCECAGLEQSPVCKPTNFFNCVEPGWAWCDELDEQGQPSGCVDACADLSGWCCDCELAKLGWWDCQKSEPESCVESGEAWCQVAPCLEACNN